MRLGKLATLLLVASLAGADDGAGAFEKGLEKVQSEAERGKWKKAKQELLELLGEHPDKDYVRARRSDVCALMKRCEFRLKYPRPDPKELVSGKLESYNAKTGKIKIRYEPSRMGDWQQGGSFYMHPAVFSGPHSITIEGPSYSASSTPQVVVCMAEEEAFWVFFGHKIEGNSYEPAGIFHRRGDEDVDRAEQEESPCKTGKKWACKVQIKHAAVTSSYNRKTILSLPKSRKLWGQLGFSTRARWTEITLEGVVEPAWIQGVVDKEDTKFRQQFESTYRDTDVLPKWLFKRATVTTKLAAPDDRFFPGPQEVDVADPWNKAMELVGKGKLEEALAYATDTPDLKKYEAVREYLRATLLQYLGRPEPALDCCAKVVGLDAAFVPVREMQATLLGQLGRFDEGAAIFRDLLKTYPGGADLHASAAHFFMRMGLEQEAQRLVELAVSRGVHSQQLDEASRYLQLAKRGPGWSRSFEYKSKHYHVVSDIDRDTCAEAAKLLESSYTAYIVRLERADAGERLFRVFLFSGQVGYLQFCKKLFGYEPLGSAGLYTPNLKVLLIWNLPQREEMMTTVRHEGFHQYLDRIMVNPPLWFNEGLAEYFEVARVVGGRWQFGAPRADHLRTLEQGTRSLDKWLFINDEEFMSKAGFNYAQSWAFVQFLRHSTRENQELFDRFWEAFKATPDTKAAMRHALGKRDLSELDREFANHLDKLR